LPRAIAATLPTPPQPPGRLDDRPAGQVHHGVERDRERHACRRRRGDEPRGRLSAARPAGR